jgi:hypothetical protein
VQHLFEPQKKPEAVTRTKNGEASVFRNAATQPGRIPDQRFSSYPSGVNQIGDV